MENEETQIKRVWNIKEDLPCIDYAFAGNMYHVWHMKRLCADGALVQISVRIPGTINGGSVRNPLRRELAAWNLVTARRVIREEVQSHGGLHEAVHV
ncbi:hypothetical protein GTB64_004428 [Salmonella enterica]|nr:hypothetical protein [Salmonella enterica]